MNLRVNKDKCFGCGACQSIAPNVFKIDDDGLAVEIKGEIHDEFKDEANDAKESCPADAIEEK